MIIYDAFPYLTASQNLESPRARQRKPNGHMGRVADLLEDSPSESTDECNVTIGTAHARTHQWLSEIQEDQDRRNAEERQSHHDSMRTRQKPAAGQNPDL